MSFEATFLDLMPHRVAITTFSGLSTDGYGRPSYAATATSYDARVVEKRERLFGADGQQLVTSHVAWVATTGNHTDRDQFTFAGSTYRIVSLARMPDEDGMHHHKFWLTRT